MLTSYGQDTRVSGAVPDPDSNAYFWLGGDFSRLNRNTFAPPTGDFQKTWTSGSERGDSSLGIFRWGDYGLVTVSNKTLVFSEHAGFIPAPPVKVTLCPAAMVMHLGE